MKTKVLVIGANGQLGSVLTKALQKKYTLENVIASDLRTDEDFKGIFEVIDATDKKRIKQVIEKYKITQIYHLAAILSAKGEELPLITWDINMKTWLNVLEVSRESNIEKVFFPSSIAVFGAGVPLTDTPQTTYLNPATVYGMSKAAGENWAQYYFDQYGLDVRSIRYPGVIGYQSLPGGGTTDYAVDIFHKAVLEEDFSCFLEKDTSLPMIYMDDVIRATIELMEAPKECIQIRTSYNIAGVSFTPNEIVAEIRNFYPNFKVSYDPDFRQDIAAGWPSSIDDSIATEHWGWKSKYNLEQITQTMLAELKEYYRLKLAM